MPLHVTCFTCGNTFSIRPARLKRARYCSKECRRESMRLPFAAPSIEPDGKTAIVPIYGVGTQILTYATIDIEDIEAVGNYRWTLNSNGYAYRRLWVNNRKWDVLMHRQILGLTHDDGIDGDHVDRNRLNNRRSNLRIAPDGENSQNVPSYRGASSRYRGVSWHKGCRKWQVNVQIKGKLSYLGLFTDELEAAHVAREARARLLPYATD